MTLSLIYMIILGYAPLAYLAYNSFKKSPATGAIVSALIALMAVLSLVYGIGLATIASYPVLAYLLSTRLRGKIPLPLLTSFILVGFVAAVPVIAYWPLESTIHFNPLAVIIGDELYTMSIDSLGDPQSPYADSTVPPILRPPTVYLVSSLAVWGLIGALGEAVHMQVRGTGT